MPWQYVHFESQLLPKQNTDGELFAEEFALIEASYGIVRVLQAFPNLRLSPQEPQEPTGQEKQSLTIVVSSAEGCRVLLS